MTEGAEIVARRAGLERSFAPAAARRARRLPTRGHGGWRRLGAGLILAGALHAAGGAPAAARTLTVGVLDYRGSAAAERTWAATRAHLDRALAGTDVRFAPMTLSELDAAAAAGRVDFVITNPGHSYQLVRRTGASRIASARTAASDDQSRALGSVVVVRADAPIAALDELAGRRLAVVAEEAFGGHLVGRRRIAQALGDPDGVATRVVGFPQRRVVEAVRRGAADAGVVRTCLLESLGGGTVPDDLRVLGARDVPRFACATSTALYPGWAVLALPRTPNDLTTAVNRALLAMPRPATVDPWLGTDGWIAPVSYAGVEALYRELGLYPFAPDLAAGLARWLRANALWVALGVIAVGLFLLHVAHIEWLVRRRTRELEAEAARNRRLERELAHTERVSSMATLAGSLAHDLNQPLAAISTFAGGLLRRQREGTLEPEAGTRALERIVEQANRASAFIAAMRRFLAKEPEHPERLDLRDVVDEAVMLLAPQARRAGLTLAWDRPRRPAPSTGVEVQLRQVVVALVQNALDATRAAGRDAPVAIDLARDGGRWRLEVADRGAGLADEAKARAFEPFFSTKEGLGLGLATAAAIVDHHDGALELRDRDGGGTTARLTLPASIEEETTPG